LLTSYQRQLLLPWRLQARTSEISRITIPWPSVPLETVKFSKNKNNNKLKKLKKPSEIKNVSRKQLLVFG